jgi:hypothetical protein
VESIFNAVSLALFVAAAATFLAIVRDVLPHLPAKDRTALQDAQGSSLGQLRARDHAIGRAWKIHAAVFPKSRKRLLFATLLVAAAFSVVGYPLWITLVK